MKPERFEAPEPNDVTKQILRLVRLEPKPPISQETAWTRLGDSIRAFQPKPRY